MHEFADRMHESMLARGLSQADVARRLGVRVATVNEWFTQARMPSGQAMVKLPEILQVNGHWLLTGKGPRGFYAEFTPDPAAGSDSAYEIGALDAVAMMRSFLRMMEARFSPPMRSPEAGEGNAAL